MATLSPQVTPLGISGPDYDNILASLLNGYQSIMGSDTVVSADSQDGQQLALFAQAIYDSGQSVIATYNNFSPATAQGAGLSSVVKINGLAREVSSSSTAQVTLVGQATAVITNGQVGDNLNLGTVWNLPPSVTIPSAGQITVTATASVTGATQAAPGSLTQILTPTFGWQSATNSLAATVGAPVESDAALRQRQAQSTGMPAQTPAQAIEAAVANVPGVTSCILVQNATDIPDPITGLPRHSIGVVVAGSATPQAVTTAIALKKAPGIQTVGNTTYSVVDPNGVPNQISYYQQTQTQIYGSILIAPLPNWAPATALLIVDAVVAYINSLGGDQSVFLNKLWAPANLSGDAAINSSGMSQQQLDVLSASYNVTAILIGLSLSTLGTADIPMSYYTEPVTAVANWIFGS